MLDSNALDGKRVVVGIDPGVNTGFAVVSDGRLSLVHTTTFTDSQWICLNAFNRCVQRGGRLELVVEDPRGQFVPFSQREPQRIKGVGSVERDCKLWIEFAEYHSIPYRLVKPGKYRKIDAASFKKLTGWEGRTSEHARAAAMMVWEGR